MASETLLVDASLATGTALLFGYVGIEVRRRRTTSIEAQEALRAFVTWWWGIAIVTAIGALRNVLAASGVLDVGIHRGITYVSLAPLTAALWGLVAYLVYVQTGSARFRTPIFVLHGAIGAFFVFLIAWLHPIGVEVNDWNVTMEYEHAMEGPLLAVTLAALLAPALVAAALYFTLFFRVRDPVARYRIAMVAGAILLWFGSAAVASIVQASDWYWWPLVSRGVSLVAAVTVLLAFRPPRGVRTALEARRARLVEGEAYDRQGLAPRRERMEGG